MLMAAAILLGLVSYFTMRVELNPDVSFGTITITTSYPGAAPEDINDLISRKIEEAVSGVTGVREVTSSSQEGLSMVVVTLELDANLDSALNDVRSKVDAITDNLPKDALKPQVLKFDNSASPVLTLSFSAKNLASRDLRDLIDNQLSDRFAQITGVASATVQGGDTREIEVQVSTDKLRAYSLGIADVLSAVSNASLNAPSGHLVNGQQDYTVRVKGDFTTPADVADTVINVPDPSNLLGKPRQVRLTDVATVKDAVVERTAYSRLNGSDSIILGIQKLKEGNAVEIANQAKLLIAGLEKEYKAQGLQIIPTFDESTQIKDSVSDMQFALMFGIFLVSAIVFVFLHNLRGTLIVALAIPTSIFASFCAMKMAGFTINNMSMLALSLAIGVLVDDAIVVLENIYRHLKMGEDPREAALNGRMEIGLAALAITMADVVVFLPIAFMGGVTGQFFKPLALGFVFATLFSLFVSFTLTPLLAARWYKAGEDMEHPTGVFANWFERRFGALELRYRNALEWALHHRWFVFCLGNASLFAVLAFIAGSFSPSAVPQGLAPGQPVPTVGYLGAFVGGWGMPLLKISVFLGVLTTIGHLIKYRRLSSKFVVASLLFGLMFPVASVVGYGVAQWKGESVFKFAFLPDSDSGQVTANIELPTGSSLGATEDVVERVEKIMEADPDVKYVVSNVGTQGIGTGSSSNNGPNYAQVAATLYDKSALTDKLPWNHHAERLRTRSSNSVAADLTEQIGRIPGASVKIAAQSGFSFGSDVQLSFRSDNRDLLMKTATAVRDGLASGVIKGVINPDISSKPGRPELRVIPDRMAAADSGVSNEDIGNAVRDLYQGNNDNKMRVNGLEYDVRVMMKYADRDNPANLLSVPIKYVQGQPVLLGSVAKVSQAPGVSLITRRDRSEEVQVTADILPGYANGSVNGDITKWLQDKHMVPEGVQFKPLGAADAQAREGVFMISALFTGVILVYMLLASLYDNLLYPFIIQLAQPQAMVGALLGLMITNETLNLVGFIGIVALTGLVAKNAILVVDYTNTLRDRGRNRHDALVEAGPTRLRPIMMTTIALVLGMLPVAIPLGRGSEFRETIGTIIIGGITLSTLLTLLVIPCSYTIFDDLTIAMARLMGKTPAHGGAEDLPSDRETPATPSRLPG
jgi:HAE1 family hydrophobic/amphiphilic exporter-1